MKFSKQDSLKLAAASALMLAATVGVALSAQQPAQNSGTQTTPSSAPTSPAPAPATKPAPPAKPSTPAKPASGATTQAPQKPPAAAQTAPKPPDSEAELQQAVESANNDSAALVRNLEAYLQKFPDAPRKPDIYRALVEASLQIRDSDKALDYAERLIAIDPSDAQVMLLAAGMLEQKGDSASLERATDYATRVYQQIEQATPDQRSDQESPEDWETSRKKAEMTVLLLRGRLEMDSVKYDDAKKDFDAAFQLISDPTAAMHLGELAEIQRHPDDAIREYCLAFVLPDQEDASVDRAVLREKLGNLWRLQHGSDAGLGERLLQAYDDYAATSKPAVTPAAPNAGIKDPLAFTLTRPDGSAPFQMASAKDEVVVLSFWATWCTPCRELEPQLAKMQQDYVGRDDVVFVAVNSDEDPTRVQPYLQQVHVIGTVVFADGLDDLLDVKDLPTLMVLDRTGKIAYRAEGYDPNSSVTDLKAAVEKTLASK